jgi:hypothetical protein
MDGVALTQALTPAYLAAYPPALAAAEVFVDQRETAYTDAEEAEIAGRLRQLGYLG